jgi:hypothetical protein
MQFMDVPSVGAPSCCSPHQQLSCDELESHITELAAHIHAATYRLLVLIAEFDRREGWGGEGVRSMAHWLNWKCGIGMNAAREKVRVARALEALPKIAECFSRGELSYSKVRALTRVANPQNQDYLLMIARHSTAWHVEQLVRQYRRVKRLEESAEAERLHEERYLQYFYDEDGSLVIEARLPPDSGALVLKALEAAREQISTSNTAEDVSAETPEPIGALRADALVGMAETVLTHGPTPCAGGERHQVVVHVSAETLCEDGEAGRCAIEGGPAIAAESARRLGCDASRVVVRIDAQGEPLSIGRRSRTVPPAIRRTLRLRDHGCRFPGCTQHRFVDAHHIEHWADGGETSLENLVLLCRHHHRLIHEGGFSVGRGADGAIVFHRPDGAWLPPAFPLESASPFALEAMNDDHGLSVTPETCVPRWHGERMDMDLAILGMLQASGEPI